MPPGRVWSTGLQLAVALAFAVPLPAADQVIAAAGDIACDPSDPSYNNGNGTSTACRHLATSNLIVGGGYDAVLVLGDNQYDAGTLASYQTAFHPTWGRLGSLLRPVAGNHEYVTLGAAGYYAYFGAAAGEPAKGWYSFEQGAWHVVVLNSNCASVGGCGPGSAQEQWLIADLAANPRPCTLAVWHHPRFSSGAHGDDPVTQRMWEVLHAARVDVVLNGHDHLYERFAPQNPQAVADPAHGIREFIVGTGGKALTGVGTVRANSEVRSTDTHGVLRMTLRTAGYDWQFLPVAGSTFSDAGSAACHGEAQFHTVRPCRLADTRQPAGPLGGPALQNGVARAFQVAGLCGVPAAATSVSLNATTVGPTGAGNLRLWSGLAPAPTTNVQGLKTGRTRGGAAVIGLDGAGRLSALANLNNGGNVHLILDVNGYFSLE